MHWIVFSKLCIFGIYIYLIDQVRQYINNERKDRESLKFSKISKLPGIKITILIKWFQRVLMLFMVYQREWLQLFSIIPAQYAYH